MDSNQSWYIISQCELIEPVLPQGAQQGVHFLFLLQHTVRDAPPWGTWLRTLHWWRKVGRDREKKLKEEKEEEKAQRKVVFEPTTSRFRGVCSTAVKHPLPRELPDHDTIYPKCQTYSAWGRISSAARSWSWRRSRRCGSRSWSWPRPSGNGWCCGGAVRSRSTGSPPDCSFNTFFKPLTRQKFNTKVDNFGP